MIYDKCGVYFLRDLKLSISFANHAHFDPDSDALSSHPGPVRLVIHENTGLIRTHVSFIQYD